MSYIRGYDARTLQEIVDAAECRDRLAEIGSQRSLPALLERTWLLKVTGDLDAALEISEQSVRTARMAARRPDILRARVLHASVLHARGQLAAADQELSTCAEEAVARSWPRIEAFALQHRGRVRLEAGETDAARADLRRALALRQDAGADADELAPILLAIDAADRQRPSSSVTL